MSTKTYSIVSSGRLYKIKWEGGGQLSTSLSGLYTSPKDASLAITRYESSKKPSRKANRGVKNGTTEDNTGA